MRLIDADSIVFDYSGLVYISPTDFKGIAEYFARQIKAMPTITPERKRGKWEHKWEDWRHQMDWLECDQCGWASDDPYNFCPNCGAEMQEDEG